jgi:hypothetical protein
MQIAEQAVTIWSYSSKAGKQQSREDVERRFEDELSKNERRCFCDAVIGEATGTS